MKLYGFTRKSLTYYEDDQITIPVAENNCANIPLLIEHATMASFYSLDELSNMYRALGLEFGIGHLNSSETILILNLFDIKLLERVYPFQKPDDSPDTCKVINDEWCRIRHEYVKAKFEANAKLAARKQTPLPPCIPIQRFEFPKPLSSK